ncbi:MAG: VWA domain-containing protein [Acidobacteria bacterium]|nr:VWA domain-containing protein [Acidobacteriota bacterium]
MCPSCDQPRTGYRLWIVHWMWLGLLSAVCQGADTAPIELQHDFPRETIGLHIENEIGNVDVQTWPEPQVRVVVRPNRVADSRRIADLIQWEYSTDDTLHLRPHPRPDSRDRLDLLVLIPSRCRIFIRTAAGRVVANGLPGALTVETESGDIVCELQPEKTDAHVALHSCEGSLAVETTLLTGEGGDTHTWFGRLGRGGIPVILYSRSGNIHLHSMDPRQQTSLQTKAAPAAETHVTTPPPSVAEPPRRSGDPAPDPPSQARAGPNPRGFRFAVRSRLVHLNVRVCDETGWTTVGLTRDDFEVFEEGERQVIAYFEPQSAPINLLLLLDLSGSTKTKMNVIRRAAIRFIESLSPADRVAVGAFTSEFAIISPFTADRNLLRRRLEDVENRGGGTAFYDSMWRALAELEKIEGARQAMVVMSDGVDNVLQSGRYTTEHEFEDLLERAGTTDITLFHIYLDTEYEQVVKERNISSRAYRIARKQIGQLAERSGGEMFRADNVEDLDAVYEQVAAELRMMYSLGYYAPSDRRPGRDWRRVEVRLKRNGCRALTRPGYFHE